MPVDCERLSLAMADFSKIPNATTDRKDERTAVLIISGRIKRGVEMTIEPAPDATRKT